MSKLAKTCATGLLLALAGCAHGTAGGPRVDADLLTQADIEAMGASNAYDVIQALRPFWLQKRGSTSFRQEGEIRVYQDGTHIGGIESLRGIHSDNIESIRFLDERQANFRFGPGHEHGAILVAMKG